MTHYHSLVLINKKKFLNNNLLVLEDLLEIYNEEVLHEKIKTLTQKETEDLEGIKLGDLLTFEEIKRVISLGNRKNETEEFLSVIFSRSMWSGMGDDKDGIDGVYHLHQGEIGVSFLKPFIADSFDEKIISKLWDGSPYISILAGQDVRAFLEEMHRVVNAINAGKFQPSGGYNSDNLDAFAETMAYWLEGLDKAYADGYSDYFLLAEDSQL